MSPEESPREAMLRRITEGIARAESRAAALRRTNNRLIWLSLVASAFATLLAAVTAGSGPVIGAGPPAWRFTCGLIAVMTGASGLLTGAHSRLNVSERLAAALTCSGKLRALELALTVTGRDLQEVARDYEDVVAGYREYLL